MANPHRGQVALKAGDREFTLSFSINATCELEDHYNLPFAQVVGKLNKTSDEIRLGDVRAFVWAALRESHPEVTMKEAGAIAQEAGLPTVIAKISECISLAFPAEGEQKKADPKKAAKA